MSQLQSDKKNKLFASRKWYATALVLILLATMQEIIMESTDLVDNFFVNAIKFNVPGFQDLMDQIKTVFGSDEIYHNQEVWNSWGLGHYVGYHYTAGQLAMNGVAASNQLYFIMFAILSGICYGFGVFNAQYFGAKKYKELQQVTLLKVYVCILVCAVVLLLSQVAGRPLIEFTTSPKYAEKPNDFLPVTADQKDLAIQWFKYFEYQAASISTDLGMHYFQTIALSYPILAINIAFITTLRETGRAGLAVWVSLIALSTNCLMNPFLVEPIFLGEFNGLGVQGAAIATTVSRVLQLAFIVTLFSFKRYEFIPRNLYSFDGFVTRRAFQKATPIVFNEIFWAVGMVVQVKLRAIYSIDALTANAIFSTIITALYTPLYHGFSAGTSILVGSRLGANNLAEAEYNGKHLVILSFMIGTVAGLLLVVGGWFFPEVLFVNNTKETFRIAHWMLFVYGLMYPFVMVSATSYAIIRTGGAVFNAFVLDALYTWIIPVPLLAILVLTSSLDIVYIIIILQVSDSLKTIWAVILLHRKKWVKNITETKHTTELDNKVKEIKQQVEA
ncbi:MATE family efflux transporter [Spiroplasma chrysopicola]|uniref:Probable multidrug resistance protein NorM n=1 Tax=Spiroplasma chrysopicola DF-1 TaxID=1276227 RepID=R4U0B1_9MOLU|nr:MATE family efflux transporter [Spiroplasma chrysopicola]AGM24652.1 MATE efflux family protein [Spiroplasma chrysopicola DF-1]